jgi:hypothetical protein
LSADLGQPEKLQRRLGDIEKILANAHERLDVPWWALRHPIHRPDLDVAIALGAREKVQGSGTDLDPIVGGQLEFNGNRDIVFLEETDQEHEVRVRIWASGHAESAAATLLGPSGATISKKEFSTKDLPFATHGCVLTVKIPKDGVTGHYLLRLERLDGPYMRCWLTQAPEKRVVLVNGEEFELGAFWGTRFWFCVPQDCTGFRIGAKPWNRATRFGFAVYDGQGRFVDAKGWYYNSQIDKLPTHWLDIKVPADARGTWWSIPYTCAKGIHFIWPKELPPYLADSPISGFLPDPEYLRLVVPQATPSSLRFVDLVAPLALCQRRIGLTINTTTQTRHSFLPIRRRRRRMGRKEKMGGYGNRVVVSKRRFHWHRASGERRVPRLYQQTERRQGGEERGLLWWRLR